MTAFSINAQSLIGQLIDMTWEDSADVHDTTVVGDDNKSFTPGLRGGDQVSANFFYDNTNTTGTYAFLTNLIGAAATAMSFSDGTRTTAIDVIVQKVSLPVKVADMLRITATFQCTGAVTYS